MGNAKPGTDNPKKDDQRGKGMVRLAQALDKMIGLSICCATPANKNTDPNSHFVGSTCQKLYPIRTVVHAPFRCGM